MSLPLLSLELRFEHDVVLARQRARQLAEQLGFDPQSQVRIATATSEIVRNAFQYVGSGRVEFILRNGAPQVLEVRVTDHGRGIRDLQAVLDGQYRSTTGMGVGIMGARRLMEQFEIQSTPETGTRVTLGQSLPRRAAPITRAEVARITRELAGAAPQNPFEELQQQNQELLRALEELRQRQAEVERLNKELEETNKGVVALYAELDEKATELQRASELKSRFLSYMSHEFRTPLNSINSLSRLLLERVDGELTAEQEKQVGFIRKSADTLSVLVNDLLDLAKIEAGKVDVHPTRWEMGELLSAMRGVFRPLLTSDTVTLHVDLAPNLPHMQTDEGKVAQILRNFISNALKFTVRGEVRVGAERGPEGMVSISVTDTGIGIAPADQERIFEEFSQVDSPIQKHVKGTGLGLPLSRKLAELLGGSVSVSSAPGVGSTFTVTIPATHAEVPEEWRELAGSGTEPGALSDVPSVLVVENDKQTLYLYQRYFHGSGYRVIPARTLAEARRCVAETPPLAVVLDILMDGETAWSFLEELKSTPATRDLPVYVVTVVNDREKALTLGADDFCLKPVQPEWLLERLQALSRRKTIETLLIVDDDEVSRYLLKGMLTEVECTVLEAATGHEGLRLARTEHPQAIILDLVMPDLTGFEVLDTLRSDPSTRDLPIIIMSSKVLSAEERTRLSGQTTAILSKGARNREEAVTQVLNALRKTGLKGVRVSA